MHEKFLVSLQEEPQRAAVRHRGDAGHVTFGAGIHHCLGAPLARLELDVSLGALVGAFPTARLAEPPLREPGFVIRGYEDVALAV